MQTTFNGNQIYVAADRYTETELSNMPSNMAAHFRYHAMMADRWRALRVACERRGDRYGVARLARSENYHESAYGR